MKHAKTAADLMTRNVVVVYPEDSLNQIAEGMALFGLRQIPVVDDGVLVGVVDERSVIGMRSSPKETLLSNLLRGLRAERSFVAEVMAAPASTVTTSASMKEVMETFERIGGNSLPVVDDVGRLVGLIMPEQVARFAGSLIKEAPPSRRGPALILRAA